MTDMSDQEHFLVRELGLPMFSISKEGQVSGNLFDAMRIVGRDKVLQELGELYDRRWEEDP